jgi:hypothetical protein
MPIDKPFKSQTSLSLDDQVADVVSGHILAGFDISTADRAMVRQIIDGSLTADEVVASILEGHTRMAS